MGRDGMLCDPIRGLTSHKKKQATAGLEHRSADVLKEDSLALLPTNVPDPVSLTL